MVNTTPISTRQLCRRILKIDKDELLALIADANSFYQPYEQIKIRKDGTTKVRNIEPSIGYLKTIQRRINKNILKPAITDLPYEIMGGREGFSITMNAKYHSKSKAIMKYDVKNFFPSITFKHVYYIFRYRLNYCEEASNILSYLTTYNLHVPQGAPTSTSIAILALEKVCLNLINTCKELELLFTIWVDDITISGSYDNLKANRPIINKIIKSTSYIINPDKDTGIMQKGSKQGRTITGVVIDHHNRLTIGRKKLKKLKCTVARSIKQSDSLTGKILFLKQINKKQGSKLYHEYKKNLASQRLKSSTPSL